MDKIASIWSKTLCTYHFSPVPTQDAVLVTTKTISVSSNHQNPKLMALNQNQVRNRVNQQNTPRMTTFSLKALTQWAYSPLDLSNSGLSKQYAEEGKGFSKTFNLVGSSKRFRTISWRRENAAT